MYLTRCDVDAHDDLKVLRHERLKRFKGLRCYGTAHACW